MMNCNLTYYSIHWNSLKRFIIITLSLISSHNNMIKILIEIAYLKAIEWLWENKCDILLTEEHLKRTKDKELIPCVLSVLMRIRTLEYLCIFSNLLRICGCLCFLLILRCCSLCLSQLSSDRTIFRLNGLEG